MVSTMAWGIQEQQGWRKGPWTSEEDKLLTEYVNLNGEGRWSSVARCAGLNRTGKSCRLRWVNYLRPGLKRGQITPQEEGIIIELHALWGNKWSTIARYLPGRTDNEIKNFWRTHFKKKEKPSRKQQKRRSQLLKDQKLQKVHHHDYDHDHHDLPHVETMDGLDQRKTNHDQAREIIEQERILTNTTNNLSPDDHHQITLANNQGTLPAMMFQDDVASYSSWSDTTAEQEYYALWGGLWNLDDQPYGRTNNNNNNNNEATGGHYCYYGGDINLSNKNIIPIQNQARAFSSHGGFIF